MKPELHLFVRPVDEEGPSDLIFLLVGAEIIEYCGELTPGVALDSDAMRRVARELLERADVVDENNQEA